MNDWCFDFNLFRWRKNMPIVLNKSTGTNSILINVKKLQKELVKLFNYIIQLS